MSTMNESVYDAAVSLGIFDLTRRCSIFTYNINLYTSVWCSPAPIVKPDNHYLNELIKLMIEY